MIEARFNVANAVPFDLDRPPPERWFAGSPFDALGLHPGRVVMIGAPPGSGKTALALQVVSQILGNCPDLRAVVGNVEMTHEDMLARIFARFALVDVGKIIDRTYGEQERHRLDSAMTANADILARLAFLDAPFTANHLVSAMRIFNARLCVIDYAQRFIENDDTRKGVDALISSVRRLALCGAGVLLISSVARQKSQSGGSTYSGLNMASFRGSSELEFGCDAAYLLDSSPDGVAVLKCVKKRFGKLTDIPLRFSGEFQTFSAGDALDLYDSAKPGGKR
jgi:replicative DNA helicase